MGSEFLRGRPEIAGLTELKPPLARIFEILEGKVVHEHTDLRMHRESPDRKRGRAWFKERLGR
jgi:hypothetical protein